MTLTGAFEGRRIYTVSAFTGEVRHLLEDSYPELWIEGEISNLSTPASGHAYFSLKDEKAQIRCALFRQKRLGSAVRPANGLKVLLRARVSLYEARGDFQLIVDYMENAGEGDLRRAMEALKQQLKAEGLFESHHKRPLPEFPRQLGLITSPGGAALRDILITLKHRAAWLPVIIYPVSVQGEAAASAIVHALKRTEQRAECDVLIIARGGGSLEDLAAFNDESVVRAVFDCSIPIIAGIGHETDITLVDFVADHRAATPTAAAQHVATAGEVLMARTTQLTTRLERAIDRRITTHMQAIDRLAGRIRHPLEKIRHHVHRVEQARDAIVRLLQQRVAHLCGTLDQCFRSLDHASPLKTIVIRRQRLDELERRLAGVINQRLSSSHQRIDVTARQLAHLDPNNTLARGYAILTDNESRNVVSSVAKARKGQSINARVADGSLDVDVVGIKDQ